jgi:hypothetical protein
MKERKVQIVMSNRANTDRVLPIDGFRQSLKSLLPLMAIVLAAMLSLQCSSGGTAAPPDGGSGGSGGGGGGVSGTVDAPSFSPTPGAFNSAQNVTITSSTSGATICYRIDGVDPTAPTAGTCGAGSITYSSAINISSTKTLKAIGTKSGMINSSVTSGTYTIDTTPPTVSSTTPLDSATGIAKNTTVAVTFSEAMNTSTISATTSTSCTGSLQVSADNFTTCVAMTSATPTASGGNTVFTMTPASALASATTYKIRVTTSVQDAAGNALASTYTTSTGFKVRYYHTITINGSYDFNASDEEFAASNSKNVQVAWDENYIYIGYTNEAFNVTNKAIYVAIDSDPLASPSSRALPFQAYYEGSTTTVPFEADYLYFVKFNGGGEKYRCVYSSGAWQTRESNPTGFSDYMQGTGGSNATELAIPRNQIGNPNKVAITVYAKDLSNNSGWGWMFGVLGETTFSQGTGDKTITKYYEFDLNGSTKPTAHTLKP